MAPFRNDSQLRSIRIAFWNANGIRDKKSELEAFIAHHNVDVFLLNESKLVPSDRFNVANYTTIRTDGPHRHGGTAVIIKRSLKYDPLPIVYNDRLETTAIKLCVGRSSFIKIAAAYARSSLVPATSDLDDVFADTIPTIAAGDFNARHVLWDRTTCAKGKVIFDYAHGNGVKIITPSSPTHFGQNHDPTTIDFVLAKNFNYSYNMYTVTALSSDHDPVIFEIASVDLFDGPAFHRPTVDWKAFHYHTFHNITVPTRTATHTQINDAIHTYNTQMSAAITAAALPPSDKTSPTLPRKILSLIREKNRTRKRWIQSRDPNIKTILNQQTARIKFEVNKHKNSLWNSHLESLSITDGSVWNTIKSITKDPFQSNITLKANDGSLVSSFAGVAKLFADSLEDQFTLNTPATQVDTDSVHFELPPHDPLPHVSPKDIGRLINSVPNRKAPGPDNITPKMLKLADSKATVALTAIINACIRARIFPDAWKTADVILFRKKQSSCTDPKNYRPISLLSVPSKIYERILLSHLLKDVTIHKILPDTQHGFRANHSTTHQITTVTEHILDGFSRHNATGAIFLDVSKAFDRVWHAGLLFKMATAGISPPLIATIKSYLSNRTFRVKHNNIRSTDRSIAAGVPQGSTLSPMLYNIYTHDIPQPTSNRTILAQYADDTAILASSISTRGILLYLNKHLRVLEDWFSKWKININSNKSVAMHFSRRKATRFNRQPTSPLQMFGKPIRWANTTTYLGITFDRRLTWTPHIDNTAKKAKGARARLYPLLNAQSKLSIRNRILLYKTLIRPIMTYACPSWGYALAYHRRANPLQTVQNTSLRRCLNTNRYVTNERIHKDLNIPPILDTIKSHSHKFFTTTRKSSNKTISRMHENYVPNALPRPLNILDDFPFNPP